MRINKEHREEYLLVENDGFPDSEKPYGLCPRCNKQSSFEIQSKIPATYGTGIIVGNRRAKRDTIDRVTSLECRNCEQPIIVFEEQFIDEKSIRDGIKAGKITWKGFFWWPFTSLKLNENVPENVQEILSEAKTTYSTKCYRASAVMSRRTLEAITNEKGETSGNLYKRINSLLEKGILDKNLGDWATEIRLIGNNGAHFDPINDVEKEDANQIILFIEELIKYLYIMPAEIEKRRKSR
jgi:hypothetical protein